MNRILPFAALLVLAACDTPQRPAQPANDVAAIGNLIKEARPEVPGLDGNWHVTMIGGTESKTIGMIAALGDGQAKLSTTCFRRAWSYTQQNNTVDFTASPSGSSNCGGQAPGAQEEAAYAALDDANLVIFGKDGREATLSGTGGTLTLERR